MWTNIISTSVKQPLPNLGVSNTIRGAVASWSKTLANELGIHQITVNNVLPGATETEFEKVSGLDKTKLFSSEKVFTAEEVAKDGYKAMLRGDLVKLTALSSTTKFVLKNMNLFPTKRILQQIKMRQEVKG